MKPNIIKGVYIRSHNIYAIVKESGNCFTNMLSREF